MASASSPEIEQRVGCIEIDFKPKKLSLSPVFAIIIGVQADLARTRDFFFDVQLIPHSG
jgi:hypothetical protein